jgi:hypothetical protein
MSGELEQLAYDLATEALKQQDSTLDELRARTGTLLAAVLSLHRFSVRAPSTAPASIG